MLTLAIDTSTNILSIALTRNEKVLAWMDKETKNNQSEILMSSIESLMNQCQLQPTALEKIAVAIGPGSYTGIRVGVTAAKSLAYALDIPIVEVSSLEIMARFAMARFAIDRSPMLEQKIDLVIPMIDARRGTVFAGVYDSFGKSVMPDGHYQMKEFLATISQNQSVICVGDQSLATRELWLTQENKLEGSKGIVLAKLAASMSSHKNSHTVVPNYLRKTEAEMNLNG